MAASHQRHPLLTRGASLFRARGSLAEAYSGRANGIGLIRLILATAVVVNHVKPLGFGQEDLAYRFFGSQTHVGTLAVYGFFVLSGMLITRSAQRASIWRYAWHRALRILPGLWMCLAVSAFVVAPLIMLREHGNLDGFFDGPRGPVQYFTANMWTALGQFGVHDLFVETTPWGRIAKVSVFDGALWSLSYEMLCYVVVGVLAVTGVLKHSRKLVLFLTVAAYGSILWHYERTASAPLGEAYGGFQLPLLGLFFNEAVLLLGFLFLLGATMDLYRERVPINDALGIASGLAFVGSLLFGGFFAIGFPAYAYLLIWLAVRMPRQLHWVGRKNDYSYGIYIYGFVCQQVLASLGYHRWGFLPYLGLSLVTTFATAYLSWHLVERRALGLKGWTPPVPAALRARLRQLPRRRPAAGPRAAETSPPEGSPSPEPELASAAAQVPGR